MHLGPRVLSATAGLATQPLSKGEKNQWPIHPLTVHDQQAVEEREDGAPRLVHRQRHQLALVRQPAQHLQRAAAGQAGGRWDGSGQTRRCGGALQGQCEQAVVWCRHTVGSGLRC